MSNKPTLKTVAEMAGVSYQTVSKILRNEIQVSPAVLERVNHAVETLNYRPSAAARTLRTRSSYLIGYSWKPDNPNYINPVMGQFQSSIVENAELSGYHILLLPQRSDQDLLSSYEGLIRTNNIDGFIISCVEYDDPRIAVLQKLGVPFVAFGRSNQEFQQYVDVDGRAGIYSVVMHLRKEGHERIALVGWPENSRVGDDRLSGYIDAMRDEGLPIDPEWIQRGQGDYEHGYSAGLRLLSLPQQRRPTAIVTLLDFLAIGVLRAVEEHGLRPGFDVAVTGFDDMPFMHRVTPGLTTLRQPAWEIGAKVVDMLIQQINGNGAAIEPVLVLPELIIRDSSRGFGQLSVRLSDDDGTNNDL
ncbi:MAG: LacI family DNA-binding transcriptional regulator [Aggregatilineales bacterium]